MRARIAVLVAAAAPVTVAVAAAVHKAGHWRLYADRHRIELKPRPRRSCPDCRGVGGWWVGGPFPEMEACGCWSQRRELRVRLLPYLERLSETRQADLGYEDLVEILKDNGHDTRPEGYGLTFLESEEFSATYFGSIAQIEQYQRENADGGQATFDASQGVMYAQWPHGKGWDTFLPRTFWNVKARGGIADGVGLITAFAHTEIPGAEVIVFEFEGKWLPDSEPKPMVTYHCTGCHLDTFHDCGHVHESTGPVSRRWAARQARQHIMGAHRRGIGGQESPCRPNNGEMLRVVNAAAREMWGTAGNALPDTDDAYCATKGPCSIIRELRAGVRPPTYRA